LKEEEGLTDAVKTKEALEKEVAKHKQIEEVLAQKERYLETVRSITQIVHKSVSLQEVFENVVEAIAKNVDKSDVAGIYMVEGEEAVLKASRGYTAQYIEEASRIPYPKGITWKTIIEGQTIFVPDVDKDEVYGPAGRGIGIKSCLCVPIISEGTSIGCLSIGSFEKNAW
jgi:putative methionine-R-sulfoxide reductase with GAF domain